MMNKKMFELREIAEEGFVFYRNVLNSPKYTEKYFPRLRGERTYEYMNRPKISAPVFRAVVDRVVNFTLKGSNINSEMREALKLALISGSCLSVLKYDESYNVVIENYSQDFYTKISPNMVTIDYELEDDGSICSVDDMEEYMSDETMHDIINDKIFKDVEHNLPFSPFSIVKNIDASEDPQYGISFLCRFKELLIEYNHILSKISKDIKVLSNVWVTNLEIENPENPVRLDGAVINYLGTGGRLEQVVRNLNLTEEKDYLKVLKENISEATQVPSHLLGLENVGKIPSGVALQLLMQPLADLVQAVRVEFVKYYRDLAPKYNYMAGLAGKDLISEEIIFSNDIVPDDKSQTLQVLTFAQQNGLLTQEELSAKVRQLLEDTNG